jgi:hypothetical protein
MEQANREKRPFAFAARRRHVLQTSVMLTVLPNLRLGRILKIIMAFEGRLIAIGEDSENAWEGLFFFAVSHAQCPQLLRYFLVFHHLIFTQHAVVGRWKKKLHRTWEQFTLGMWHVLREDPRFLGRCADPQEMKRLFEIEAPDPKKRKKSMPN